MLWIATNLNRRKSSTFERGISVPVADEPRSSFVALRFSLHVLFQSPTSIGANIEEGRAGQSKADFIAKNFNSLKESRETRFWLRVIGVTDPPLERELQPLLQEATEFIAMLTTSLKNARLSASRGTQNSQ